MKDGLSACNSRPFALQKMSFCDAFCRLLQGVSQVAYCQAVKNCRLAVTCIGAFLPIIGQYVFYRYGQVVGIRRRSCLVKYNDVFRFRCRKVEHCLDEVLAEHLCEKL